MPKVSVVVPSCRGTNHLSNLLRDLSNQTFKDFELIIVYDGKPSEDVKTLMETQPEWVKFHTIPKERDYGTYSPGTKARNFGVSMAKGEYLCFADDDDRFKDTWIEALLENAGPNRIALIQIYIQESRIYRDGDPNRTLAIPEIGLDNFPVLCHCSTLNFMLPKKWALETPWENVSNHDYHLLKTICEKYNPQIGLSSKGPQADVDGKTIKGLRDWVSHPPFYRDNPNPAQIEADIKYSILMPYYNRYEQLRITLNAFKTYYGHRKDWEVIVIEELKNFKNPEMHSNLEKLIALFSTHMKITSIIYKDRELFNPSPLFNLGAKFSKGKFLVLTNPECMPVNPLLEGFDSCIEKSPNYYIACSCMAVDPIKIPTEDFFEPQSVNLVEDRWLDHPIYLPRNLHWCSCISKQNFYKIGQFDEDFSYGIAYEDDAFIRQVMFNNLTILNQDDLKVLHINHNRDYQTDDKGKELYEKNKQIFIKKWA